MRSCRCCCVAWLIGDAPGDKPVWVQPTAARDQQPCHATTHNLTPSRRLSDRHQRCVVQRSRSASLLTREQPALIHLLEDTLLLPYSSM
jgi:hypothetical protein